MTLSLELGTDLAGEGLLVGIDGQEHVGPLAADEVFSVGVAPSKNGCVVCITGALRANQPPAQIREAWSGTSWIVELAATGTRDGKPFCATHLFLKSLRPTSETPASFNLNI